MIYCLLCDKRQRHQSIAEPSNYSLSRSVAISEILSSLSIPKTDKKQDNCVSLMR